MEGSAQFLVLAVGLNSQTGLIMKLMGAAKHDETEDANDDNFDKVSVKSKIFCNFESFFILLENV